MSFIWKPPDLLNILSVSVLPACFPEITAGLSPEEEPLGIAGVGFLHVR